MFVLPVLANCSELTKAVGRYDQNENATTSKIIVDLTRQGQIIDKNFYGSHIDSYSEIPTRELVDELQLGQIRIGGNEFDVNNWKNNKSVTSSLETKTLLSFEAYSKILRDFNVNGIFQINLTGYQPELEGGTYVVKRSFTSESAYEMVKYLNGVKKLKIRDFSLGNEFSIWHETHSKVWQSDDGISADDFIDRYIKFAIAVRRAQEEVNGNPNSIKLWGPEISTSWTDWNTGNMTTDCQWTDILGQVACSYGNKQFDHFLPYFFHRLAMAEKDSVVNPKKYKLLDYMSIHYYANFRTKINDPSSIVSDSEGRQRVADMLESTRLFNDPTFTNTIDISSYRNAKPNVLGRVNSWINQYYPNVKLAMNEFAVDSDYRSTHYHPIIRPLYLADLIGIMTKENVAFFNQFLLSSGRGSNLPWTMIEGGVKKNLFNMYKLFTNNFKGFVLNVEDNMGDEVNSYATLKDNTINLVIVNKEPVSKTVNIYVKNNTLKKLTTYVVPAWSSAILKLGKNPTSLQTKFDIVQFGAEEMGIPRDTAYMKKR
jgi:hypothetical protein